MRLSIISTLFWSVEHMQEFHRRATEAALDLVGDSYEIVFVNDGSPDNSLELAVGLSERDCHVAVVDLSRNFGHHKAMMAGLEHSSGDLVFLIDSDLEECPEWLADFHRDLNTTSSDVVYGVQRSRKGGFLEKLTGRLFYTVFEKMTGTGLPRNLVTARLMTRRYVDALLLHREREFFLAGLWHLTGFAQTPRIVEKHSISNSRYGFFRKISLAINMITSFSNLPLIIIFYLGALIFAMALFYAGYLVVHRLVTDQILGGWTSLMASIWILGGMIISFIGIVGLYLSKIYTETKQRPYVIVRQVYGRQKQQK